MIGDMGFWIADVRVAFGGAIIKTAERSDINKSQITNHKSEINYGCRV